MPFLVNEYIPFFIQHLHTNTKANKWKNKRTHRQDKIAFVVVVVVVVVFVCFFTVVQNGYAPLTSVLLCVYV